MANAKDLKKRIGTVKNTQQTTKAMKMVSAAKLRRAQEAITAQRPFAKHIGQLIAKVAAMPDVKVESQLLSINRAAKSAKDKKVLVVVVTSDRGLCGGFNSNVIKRALRWEKENRGVYGELKFAFVGRRGRDAFRIRGIKDSYYSEFGRKVTTQQAFDLNRLLIDQFLAGEYDEVKFIYNEFKNAISQEVIVEDFLPLTTGIESVMEGGSQEKPLSPDVYLAKPSASELLHELLKRHFGIQAMRILLESQASEHGARMSAMDNATRNAGEMIRKLTLFYNKERQANITREMLEIIGGSESQKVR